jgi:hypothetical protein
MAQAMNFEFSSGIIRKDCEKYKTSFSFYTLSIIITLRQRPSEFVLNVSGVHLNFSVGVEEWIVNAPRSTDHGSA